MTQRAVCSRCESPLEAGDLRCAICGRAAEEHARSVARASIQVLRCESCGAAVSYDAKVGAPNCSFCDSVMRLEELVDPVEQTEGYAPFRVTRDEARAALAAWLKRQGFFRPADLAQRARLESIKAIYWVAWVCDARAYVTWTADSNEGAWRSAWAPHSGAVQLAFDDVLVSASRGLREEEVRALAPYVDLKAVAAEPSVLSDGTPVALETFDVQRSGARRRIVSAIHRSAAHVVERDHVPGTRFREVHTSALLESLETRRLALPAWVFAYRYEDRLYRAVVSGGDARGITGKLPFSLARLFLVIGAVILAGLAALTLLPILLRFFLG
ncbi:MAG: zinc ribbon domain-containing protein [Planctomycetes bacterium]|nr:zinc ribbon domain-containing protein [Planctomycetota bacterium]MCB9903510.1 zinc ribbon domain-containing protein [Planctomycetota bacterium]